MDTKPLLYGLIGFFLGGLLVSFAATYIETPQMHQSAEQLRGKTGDDFDKTFIEEMILHHEGAIEMAEAASKNAKHEEIKTLSKEMIASQSKEVNQMQAWQVKWGYQEMPATHQSSKGSSH
jgi:uncharacterized protein (DUF305 family)